jgi:glycosyltransferase involved in cell wall biosynthesis
MTNIVAIVPAFNSASTISDLVSKILALGTPVIVIDDGSTDSTGSVAASAGARVLSWGQNRGKGLALRAGFTHALNENYDAVLTLDSDGQHIPGFIPDFIRVFDDTHADLIIGSRYRDKANMPWDRRFSNWTTSHILSLLLKRHIEDSQSGFRLYSRKLLQSVQFESDHFEIETEAIIKAVHGGFEIKFIPIRVEYGFGLTSHMNRFWDTIRWCRKVLEII